MVNCNGTETNSATDCCGCMQTIEDCSSMGGSRLNTTMMAAACLQHGLGLGPCIVLASTTTPPAYISGQQQHPARRHTHIVVYSMWHILQTNGMHQRNQGYQQHQWQKHTLCAQKKPGPNQRNTVLTYTVLTYMVQKKPVQKNPAPTRPVRTMKLTDSTSGRNTHSVRQQTWSQPDTKSRKQRQRYTPCKLHQPVLYGPFS